MQVSSAAVVGLLAGVAVGIISVGKVDAASPQIVAMLREDAWWIVVLSMVVPLAEYLSGMRTTVAGVITRHPFRHFAGFFAGLSVGLGLFLLLAPRVLSGILS